MIESMVSKTDSGHVCPHKFGFILDNRFRRLIQKPKKIVGEYIKSGHVIIDLGCGPGFFSIDMAKMAGEAGKVIAVDLQEHMLSKVKRKAKKHGVLGRMEFHQCGTNTIGLNRKADFILAYYMVHETPAPRAFFLEVSDLLKEGAGLLVVEPKIHVNRDRFKAMLRDAEKAGLKAVDFPKGKGGRSVLLRRG